MPYVPRDEQAVLDRALREFYHVRDPRSCSPGQMNYIITKLLLRYMGEVGYFMINSIRGILACVGDEFYWRVARPYEDEKREENGDVYGS